MLIGLLTIPSTIYAQSTPSADTIFRKLNRAPSAAPARRSNARSIKRSRKIRHSLPSVDINSINFAFGSANIARSERWKVRRIADAILRFRRGRREVFLVEGHTDAVGSDSANQLLSERRAFSLKSGLVSWFGVPPRMLITEGYGESELLVQTQRPNRRNRRVTIRRATDYLR